MQEHHERSFNPGKLESEGYRQVCPRVWTNLDNNLWWVSNGPKTLYLETILRRYKQEGYPVDSIQRSARIQNALVNEVIPNCEMLLVRTSYDMNDSTIRRIARFATNCIVLMNKTMEAGRYSQEAIAKGKYAKIEYAGDNFLISEDPGGF